MVKYREWKKSSTKLAKADNHQSSNAGLLCPYRIPVAMLFLLLIFIWSSSTTIMSGSIVHVCISNRKFNNLYCLSAGTQPNFEVPIDPFAINTNNNVVNRSSSSNSNNNVEYSNSTADHIEVPTISTTSTNGNHNTNDNNSNNNNEVREENVFKEIKMVKEQLDLHRSWRMADSNVNTNCNGGGVFVYDMPSKFNTELLEFCSDMVPWMDFCQYFKNNGLGAQIPELGNNWYQTHQYSLEPIFHSRILKHPCRVHNVSEAKLFYVPYYGGLDVLRWHFKNVSIEIKDVLALDLMNWLDRQPTWARNAGKDHVFVLGKISFDFRRRPNITWGTRLLELHQMQNPLKLLIERQPWHVNDVGVPHPTFFHPHTDNDIIEWQLKVMRSKRENYISFAGAARPGDPNNIRSLLIKQCTALRTNETDHQKRYCHFIDCKLGGCSDGKTVVDLFMKSEFCLQPKGDSATRKSVFDSLVAGCIPVLFSPFTAYYQYPWHLPEDHSLYSMFIDQEEVKGMKIDVVERLMKVSVRERELMRRYIVYELMPGLVYGDLSSEIERFQDAFSISINNMFHRVNTMQLSSS
ncbi:hypothetical protein Sjap_004798 [Stephania japonica]|uniref:Exostosin GT47 domain-containing protein n=1 Tax=Stephania japonica TaxID=461633 RepID=A0AAP0PKJ8_9MAGN